MRLPYQISPNPLVTSTVEIRYYSSFTSNKLFPTVYQIFQKELPNLEHNNIPKDIKTHNPLHKYIPDYILSNDRYKLLFSDCVLTFEHVADYTLWPNYFKFITEAIRKFFKAITIQRIDRVGVRYASVLDKTSTVGEVLNYIPNMLIEGYKQKFEHYRTNLLLGETNLLLQIYENAVSTKPTGTISGVYIDIDASQTLKDSKHSEEIIKIVDTLHSDEKKLFYSLLKPEFLQKLNPKY